MPGNQLWGINFAKLFGNTAKEKNVRISISKRKQVKTSLLLTRKSPIFLRWFNLYLILKTKNGFLAWQVQVNYTQNDILSNQVHHKNLFSIFSKLIIFSSSKPARMSREKPAEPANLPEWTILFLFLLYYFVVFFCSQSSILCQAISPSAKIKQRKKWRGRKRKTKQNLKHWLEYLWCCSFPQLERKCVLKGCNYQQKRRALFHFIFKDSLYMSPNFHKMMVSYEMDFWGKMRYFQGKTLMFHPGRNIPNSSHYSTVLEIVCGVEGDT